MVRLTAPQTYRIISYLLAHPKTSQVEIATTLNVSRDLTNHVVKELELTGITEQKSRGHLELKDPFRLLEALSFERPLSKLLVKTIRTEESDVNSVEKKISTSASSSSYALTAFSALSRHLHYYISYPTVHVYTTAPQEFVERISPGMGDVAMHVLRPDSETILENAKQIGGVNVVDQVQTVIDLFALSGPGRDGAMKLYQMVQR